MGLENGIQLVFTVEEGTKAVFIDLTKIEYRLCVCHPSVCLLMN